MIGRNSLAVCRTGRMEVIEIVGRMLDLIGLTDVFEPLHVQVDRECVMGLIVFRREIFLEREGE